MKKWLGWAVAFILLLGMVVPASAEQAAVYQVGDIVEDFTATMSDGTQVSLYELLLEKKAVLINFWASWCRPCKLEFPVMEEAYEEMSDEIGIIALSREVNDTDEIVLALKQELGLDSLPMGVDTGNLSKRFKLLGIPTSIIVDRNGVFCYQESGCITDKDKFLRLFSLYTADDYSQPQFLTEVPTAKPTVAYPSASEIRKAFQISDEKITVQIPDDETSWPFVAGADDSCLQATNTSTLESVSRLILDVDAEAGEALQFEYALSCPAVYDCLTVTVDGERVKYFGGNVDWTSDYVQFDTTGTHRVVIAFKRGSSKVIEANAALRNAQVLTAQQTNVLNAQAPIIPKPLSGNVCDIEIAQGDFKSIIVTEHTPGMDPSQQTMTIVQGGPLTLRILIGDEVDESEAYISESSGVELLANLPRDDRGFLYETRVLGLEDGNANFYSMFIASTSGVDITNCFMKSITCFASEADVDAYIKMNKDMAAAAGMTGYQMSWEYADGASKLLPIAEAQDAAADGMAEYRIIVADEKSDPVSGAMIQICDEKSCLVAVTDAEGVATHTGTPYPYEIHLLMAPEGYQANDETFVMPQAGGEITIALQKK